MKAHASDTTRVDPATHARHFRRRQFLRAAAVLCGGSAFAVAAPSQRSRLHAAESPEGLLEEQSEYGVQCERDAYESAVGQGFPPTPEHRVTLDNWMQTGDHVRWTQQHAATVFHSVPISRGSGPVSILARRMIDPEACTRAHVAWGLPNQEQQERIPVGEWWRRMSRDAVVILHDGHIVFERYWGRMTASTRHSLWSVSKSVLASVTARYLKDRTLNQDAPVTEYVPELACSAFEGARIRHLLDMQAGAQLRCFLPPREMKELSPEEQREWRMFTPEFKRADHEFARLLRASGFHPALSDRPTQGCYDFLSSLGPERPHGTVYYYSDASPIPLQWALERATEKAYAELLTDLWQTLGAEHDATMMIDGIGTAAGHIGFTATARDMARWGEMLRNHGSVGHGRAVPGIRELMEDTVNNPQPEKWTEESNDYGVFPYNTGYRNLTFTTPAVVAPDELITFAFGAFNQFVHVDRQRKNVVVQFSTYSDREDPDSCMKDIVANHSFLEDVLPELL